MRLSSGYAEGGLLGQEEAAAASARPGDACFDRQEPQPNRPDWTNNMTVGRGPHSIPPRDGRRTPGHDDKQAQPAGYLAPPNDERSTDPRDLIRLAGRILGSWGHTTRTLVLTGTLLAVTFAGLHLASADISVGPVHLRGRAHPEGTVAP